MSQNCGPEEIFSTLVSRRSVGPRRLSEPGPSREEVRRMIEAALTAPDHGGLRPWRFLEIRNAGREQLGELFARAKRARDPNAPEDEVARERDRGRQAPVTLCLICRLQPDHETVPLREQYAAMGAAMQNILILAHAMGYGAKMLSGNKVFDPVVLEGLGVGPGEALMGFICLGTIVKPPRPREPVPLEHHFSSWPLERA